MKRRTPTNASKLTQGRGQGHGKDYKPFLTVRDVPSMGLSTRIKSWKIDRIHHLLSNQERDYFLSLVWSPMVVDIREQYPLPLAATIDIATRLDIKHPSIPKTKEAAVMTTDFLITVLEDGDTRFQARTVKQSKDLNNARVVEKLEIERTYWSEQGIDWGIVTEHEIPTALSKNVSWILSAYEQDNSQGISVPMLIQIEELLFELITKQPEMPLSHIALDGDRQLGLQSGTCLWAVRHIIARLIWVVDMFEAIDACKPLHIIKKNSLEEVYTESGK